MKLSRRSRMGAKGIARTLLPMIPAVLGLLGGLMRDARVSFMDRGLVVAVILYVVSPLDLIPDVFGVLGLTDDLFLVAVVLRRLLLGAGSDVLRAHWSGSRGDLDRLLDAVDDLGSLLPGPIRTILKSFGRAA